jgi:hypothetical protein
MPDEATLRCVDHALTCAARMSCVPPEMESELLRVTADLAVKLETGELLIHWRTRHNLLDLLVRTRQPRAR